MNLNYDSQSYTLRNLKQSNIPIDYNPILFTLENFALNKQLSLDLSTNLINSISTLLGKYPLEHIYLQDWISSFTPLIFTFLY